MFSESSVVLNTKSPVPSSFAKKVSRVLNVYVTPSIELVNCVPFANCNLAGRPVTPAKLTFKFTVAVAAFLDATS